MPGLLLYMTTGEEHWVEEMLDYPTDFLQHDGVAGAVYKSFFKNAKVEGYFIMCDYSLLCREDEATDLSAILIFERRKKEQPVFLTRHYQRSGRKEIQFLSEWKLDRWALDTGYFSPFTKHGLFRNLFDKRVTNALERRVIEI